MSDDDMTPLGASLEEMFRRMGLPDPEVMAKLSSEWEEIAPPPWPGRSKPLYIEGRTLVVEAGSPSLVAFLRYGEPALIEALARSLGEGVIHRVEVRPPTTK
jgi:hypothetical protein